MWTCLKLLETSVRQTGWLRSKIVEERTPLITIFENLIKLINGIGKVQTET